MAAASQKSIKWQLDILPRQTKKALEYLSGQKWLKKSPLYLAGGTALALQAGHRSSVDLDFFSPRKNLNNTAILKRFINNKNWKTTINEEGTIYGELFEAKVSFIAYPFFRPEQKVKYFNSAKIINPLDIAVMKIVAISQRGRKRDFFDLYWCAKNLEPLGEIILRLKKQYRTAIGDYHHILKSLVYFADAENDPDPKIYFKASWKEVKKYFQKETPKIAREIIGL